MERRVMRRVRRIYYLKRMLHPTLCKAYAGLFLTGLGALMVSVGDIARNLWALSEPQRVPEYLAKALIATEPAVQLTAIGFIALVAWLCYDLVRLLGEVGERTAAHP